MVLFLVLILVFSVPAFSQQGAAIEPDYRLAPEPAWNRC